MAIEPALLDACAEHLETCLLSIHKVIQKANEILSSISQPSVCREVLLSSQGVDYISGVVEVYRVSKRMEEGIKAFNITCEKLQLLLRDIELDWNNLQAFLSMCPNIFPIMPSSSELSKVDQVKLDASRCLQSCCGICLHDRKDQQETSEPSVSMLDFNGRLYHPSCANFWLHCVDSSLPALCCQASCASCVTLQTEVP